MILDDEGQEIGFNQVGEIAVKSRYLSPGYWRSPDLTQTRFLPDPDGGDQRICLTGDLGRMLPDGCLEHLGRKDLRANIRGYMVEVVEVELALLDIDPIEEAVVVARDDAGGNERLVAYIVLKPQSVATVSELRRVLAETLPDYMIPAAFVTMDALPLTPTGKVDRLVLPDTGSTRPELDESLAISTELGMRPLMERVLSRRDILKA